jgi:hypothetical protein
MRKISASHIMPVSSPPLRNGILVLGDEGNVLEVIDTGGQLRESSHLEYYPGIITPGFIIPCYRMAGLSDDIAESAFRDFDRLLLRQGIKGIGVLERQGGHFEIKEESPVTYHTILELCPGKNQDEFEAYQQGINIITEAWNEHNQTCSISCCTSSLMETDLTVYILRYAAGHQQVIPLKGENKWSLSEQMARLNQLMEHVSEVPTAGLLTNAHVVMMHDLVNPQESASMVAGTGREILPAFHFPVPDKDLNILSTMMMWQDLWDQSSLLDVLPAFTIDAAKALFEDKTLGSIEPGKTPGLNLLSNTEPGTFRLTAESTFRVLV